MKFPALVEAGENLGAQYVATGHYARTSPGPDGRTLLRKGMPANDQSYMLSRLTQGLLHRALFPLGGYEKDQIRALAEELGLPVAWKPDSMEICFIPGGDYAAWLDRRGETPPPGNFIDREGMCWAATGASTTTPSARAGGWGSQGPTAGLSRPSTPPPTPSPSPTAAILWPGGSSAPAPTGSPWTPWRSPWR